MNTLKRIYEYEVGMESMIAKGHVATFRFSSLADFVSQLITALLEDIDIKSKNYKKPALANLFSLNNLHYIIKGIKGTKLAEAAGQKLIADMEKAIKKQIDMYRGSWMPLITVLVDETKISDKGKIVTVLSKQQRDVIKEKFKTFNKDFEEICTAQMKYAIPDVALRLQVINEVKAILLPMYNRFYDRYTASDNDFSKNPEKYIKFTKEQLSATMDKFFDASN